MLRNNFIMVLKYKMPYYINWLSCSAVHRWLHYVFTVLIKNLIGNYNFIMTGQDDTGRNHTITTLDAYKIALCFINFAIITVDRCNSGRCARIRGDCLGAVWGGRRFTQPVATEEQKDAIDVLLYTHTQTYTQRPSAEQTSGHKTGMRTAINNNNDIIMYY